MPLIKHENQGDKLTVAAGGLIDVADEHGLKIAGVEITAVNAGAALLEGVTGGTVTANKAVVVDANKAVDTLDITSPKIGGVSVTASATELNRYSVNAYMADGGTAGSVFVVCPFAGDIKSLRAVNAVANAGTKTVLTALIATVAVTHAAWEIAVTAAAGTGVSIGPTAANTVAAGTVLEIHSDGGSSSVMPIQFTIEIER